MQFQGLPLTQLLAIGGAASAVVGLLYLLELRRRSFPVPFAELWARVLRDREATKLFSKLKRLLSLLLQLILLALLLFALGDPRPTVSLGEGRHLVVLVDASASMQAIDVATGDEPNRTRLDVAKGEVERLAKGLRPADRMLLAQMDASVTPLSVMTGEIADIEEAIKTLRPTDTRADLPRALRFANDVLRGLSSPEIVVVSDGALGGPHDNHLADWDKVKLSHVPIGERGRNVAVTGLVVRRYPLDRDRYEVMLELYNGGDEEEDVELRLLGDGEVVDVKELRIGPREKLPRFYPNLSGARATLEAEIRLLDGSRDDLPADDRAYALLPDVTRARVLCVTKGNTYLEAALLLASYLDVTYLDPESFPPKEGSFDVTILDGVTFDMPNEAGNILYLDPSGPSAPLKVADKPLVNVGFDKVDRKSPLLRWTAIEDAFIAKARRLGPSASDKVIGASDLGPLLVTGNREGRRFIAVGFDPRDSDIVLRAAWPVFVLNALNELVSEDAAFLSSYPTGRAWHLPISGEADAVTMTGPRGEKRGLAVEDGRAVFFGKEAGFYSLSYGEEGKVVRFAANLADPEESTIHPVAKLELLDKEAGRVSDFAEGSRSEWWIHLLLAAVLLTTIEWITYHRRVTV